MKDQFLNPELEILDEEELKATYGGDGDDIPPPPPPPPPPGGDDF